MNNPKFQEFTGKDGQYYFRLRAGNGEIILQSEGYTQKQGCEHGIDSVKQNAADFNNFKQNMSIDDKYYFVLKARNHETIGLSEMYESKQACKNGINSVHDNAPISPVEDLI